MKLVGHKKQQELLRSAFKREKLPHALLLSGPESIGKRCVALDLAAEILGIEEHPELEEKFWRGEHPDIHILNVPEDKKEISVEQARDFISSLQLKPYFGKQRVAIIDDAHLLGLSASNALLLTLEEPPANCYIILVTHSPQRLLPTILSRAQEMVFYPLSQSEVKEILLQLGVSENVIPALGEDIVLELFHLGELRGQDYLLKPSASIEKHIHKKLELVVNLRKQIAYALKSGSTGELLSLASLLGEKEYPATLVFRILIEQLHDTLLKDQANRKISEALLQAIQLERATQSRNLNVTNQLSNFLVSNYLV